MAGSYCHHCPSDIDCVPSWSVFTLVLNGWIVKLIIERGSYGLPPNLEAIKENVIHDIIYDEHGIDNSLLDIYYPRNAQGALLPVVIWIHGGGGFISGSKEGTKVYGMTLVNEGYVVANINYAVAPGQQYPGLILGVIFGLAILGLGEAKGIKSARTAVITARE